jgi:hypothetical protein
MPWTTPPAICPSTTIGLIMLPQSSLTTRRASSATANPDPGRQTGRWTAVTSSSGSSAVVKEDTKKSAAGMRRLPRTLRASIPASSSASISTAASAEAERWYSNTAAFMYAPWADTHTILVSEH